MHYFAIALLSAALFGASTPIGKLLLDSLPPFLLAGLLYLGAAIGVLPFCLRRKSTFGFTTLSGKAALLLGGAIFFGGILGPVLLLFGLRLASSATVAMWLNLELAATAFLGVLFFRDHLGIRGWLGVIGTLAASTALSWNEGDIGIAALLLVAGASLCWGLDNHFTSLIDAISPSQSTLWKGIVAGVCNILIGLFAEQRLPAPQPAMAAMAVGVFSYGFSITLYIWAAQNLGATRSQMIFASAPFFGVALSIPLLGETLSLLQVGAALLLAASITLLVHDSHAHSHDHPALEHTHAHRHDDQHHNHRHGPKYPEIEHSHWHEHAPLSHSHPHWPDLHHRHDHNGGSEETA